MLLGEDTSIVLYYISNIVEGWASVSKAKKSRSSSYHEFVRDYYLIFALLNSLEYEACIYTMMSSIHGGCIVAAVTLYN